MEIYIQLLLMICLKYFRFYIIFKIFNIKINFIYIFFFQNKSYDQLEKLNNQIRLKISNVNKETDVGYWEAILQTLSPYMAKLRLKELHKKKLAIRLKHIKNEQIFNRNTYENDSNFDNSNMNFYNKIIKV